jgi:hypothetical protein
MQHSHPSSLTLLPTVDEAPAHHTPDTPAEVDGKTEEVPTVHPNFEFMKGSRWLWNNWREVEFTTDGSFVAPAENCDVKGNAACKW